MIDEDLNLEPSLDEETTRYLELWSAKLRVHVQDIVGPASDLDRSYSRNWMFLSDETGVGSFFWICSLFGLDPDRVRTQIDPDWRVKYPRWVTSVLIDTKKPSTDFRAKYIKLEQSKPRSKEEVSLDAILSGLGKYDVPKFIGGKNKHA